ncbi:DUF4942 domain-containing protein [Alkalihalophilus pseudofirmus]|uniref:DUF4942 domain-containing protein n=1 Tax=Alkalihalophilus pseudofirmus TaxID=79885 RepID=UPI00259B32D0|nr:DUF4942 domain-containing protein [Alkalihalophilus pseudofirmus]WEG18606.1 DUF4942 domain-containing protein [Alkalihalophilus pseudofirmus]
MFNDNKDFYPTPEHLFYKLMNGKRYLSGRILEPSAGKGDLIGHIKKLSNRDVKIDAIEKDSRLSNILSGDGISVVWDDFLTYNTFKEYDFIIMNPPFSNGVDHLLKAIELAEQQLSSCDIYAIVNKETIDNAYSNKRQNLLHKISSYNGKVEYVSNGFSDSERKTNVEVALVRLSVAKNNQGKSIYDRIVFNSSKKAEQELSTALSTTVKNGNIQSKINDIERLVAEYETACDLAKKAYQAMREREVFFNYIDTVNKGDNLYSNKLNLISSHSHTTENLNQELDKLRHGYWQLILDTDEFKELLTNDAIQELNRRMNLADELEINLQNIKMLITAINYNRQDMLMESVVSIFRKITRYHQNQYSTNIHYYNGWKTNDAFKINKKIIIPIKYVFDGYYDFSDKYENINSDTRRYIDDIVKAFKLIDHNVEDEFVRSNENEFENNLLRFKMFKNGNIHIWFKDLQLLSKLNYLCGKHFNWLPTDDEMENDRAAREYVYKEFGETKGISLLTA